MDPVTMLAALAPLGVEFGKAIISKFFGQDNFKPASVDDWLKMRDSDLAMFKAINDAGGANPSWPWVEAVVRLQRPAVAAIALGVWAYSHVHPGGVQWWSADAVDNFAAAIGFYLFGDRTLFYVRKAAVK